MRCVRGAPIYCCVIIGPFLLSPAYRDVDHEVALSSDLEFSRIIWLLNAFGARRTSPMCPNNVLTCTTTLMLLLRAYQLFGALSATHVVLSSAPEH